MVADGRIAAWMAVALVVGITAGCDGHRPTPTEMHPDEAAKLANAAVREFAYRPPFYTMVRGTDVRGDTVVITTTISGDPNSTLCCPEDDVSLCDHALETLRTHGLDLQGIKNVQVVDRRGKLVASGSAEEKCALR
jgi:hypothetical protein